MNSRVQGLTLGPVQTNCWILFDPQDNAAAVIDPGWPSEEILKIVAARGGRVTHILLTHAHFDHIGGVAQLAARTGAPVALHPLDLPMYRHLGGAREWNIPIQPGPEPRVQLEAGQVIRVGSLSLEVMFVPGHTPGHVAFYERAQGILFDGDVLFAGSIGRTDLPGGDYDTLMASINAHLLRLPDATEVYPGHGPVTTIGAERRANPFLG